MVTPRPFARARSVLFFVLFFCALRAQDIYSLGIMFFEMCHPAFATGMERAVVLRNMAKQQLPPAWPIRAAHPRLCELLLTLLCKDPAKRPSARQVQKPLSLSLPPPAKVV